MFLHLVEGLAGHLYAVHLEHLVVDGQEAGGLRQAAGNQPGGGGGVMEVKWVREIEVMEVMEVILKLYLFGEVS